MGKQIMKRIPSVNLVTLSQYYVVYIYGEGGVDSYFEPQILIGDPLRGKTRVAQFWFLKDWGRGRA